MSRAFVFVLLAPLALALDWYASYGLSAQESEYLKEKRCFRGTYGLEELSLLTCKFGESHFFTELPDNTPLCIVELAHANHARAAEIATQLGAVVVHNAHKSLVIAAKDPKAVDYPSACFSPTDYLGLALNVIPVPTTPMFPIVRYESPRLAINEKIKWILGNVSVSSLRDTVTTLSNYNSRHSLSATAPQAVTDATKKFENWGWTASQQSINRSGYCNNSVAIRIGTVNPNNYVVIGAHLDDRAANINTPDTRAPGADDNGSGSAAVLELAKLISQQPGLIFQNTLVLTLFCGEEQGLYGSDFQAKQFKANSSIRILAMYNADMLGYNNRTASYANTLALVNRSVDTTLTNECKTVIGEYLPTLKIGGSSACCSDQQSYNAQGFPAMGFFETATTSVVYPQYHSVNDTPSQLDFDQVSTFSQAIFACALTKAVPN